MWKEIDDLYCYLEKLEEACPIENSTYQEYLALNEARMKVDIAILNIEILLTKLYSQNEVKNRLDV